MCFRRKVSDEQRAKDEVKRRVSLLKEIDDWKGTPNYDHLVKLILEEKMTFGMLQCLNHELHLGEILKIEKGETPDKMLCIVKDCTNESRPFSHYCSGHWQDLQKKRDD